MSLAFLFNWLKANEKVDKEFNRLMDEIILEAYKNGGFKMPLTAKEKEEINKDIANRVYAEGLKFKGVIKDLEKKFYNRSTALQGEIEGEIGYINNRLIKMEYKETSEKNIQEIFLSTLAKNRKENEEEKKPKGWKAPKDWEQIVHKFAEIHPHNSVAKLIAEEPDYDRQSFPDNHGKKWQEEDDIKLSNDIRDFIRFNARILKRNPSSIAFRVIRQLKYIGIELI